MMLVENKFNKIKELHELLGISHYELNYFLSRLKTLKRVDEEMIELQKSYNVNEIDEHRFLVEISFLKRLYEDYSRTFYNEFSDEIKKLELMIEDLK